MFSKLRRCILCVSAAARSNLYRYEEHVADIVSHLGACDFIGLPGTQISASNPVEQDELNGFIRFNWGRGKGAILVQSLVGLRLLLLLLATHLFSMMPRTLLSLPQPWHAHGLCPCASQRLQRGALWTTAFLRPPSASVQRRRSGNAFGQRFTAWRLFACNWFMNVYHRGTDGFLDEVSGHTFGCFAVDLANLRKVSNFRHWVSWSVCRVLLFLVYCVCCVFWGRHLVLRRSQSSFQRLFAVG